MKKMKTKKSESESQAEKFAAAARELGCSDDESAFDKTLKKVATAPSPKSLKKRKKKKTAK